MKNFSHLSSLSFNKMHSASTSLSLSRSFAASWIRNLLISPPSRAIISRPVIVAGTVCWGEVGACWSTPGIPPSLPQLWRNIILSWRTRFKKKKDPIMTWWHPAPPYTLPCPWQWWSWSTRQTRSSNQPRPAHCFLQGVISTGPPCSVPKQKQTNQRLS